jgi:hypothetical protein
MYSIITEELRKKLRKIIFNETNKHGGRTPNPLGYTNSNTKMEISAISIHIKKA